MVEFHTFVSSSSTCTNAFYIISKKILLNLNHYFLSSFDKDRKDRCIYSFHSHD